VDVHRGDRVRITGLQSDDPAPLAIGEEGTVLADGPNFAGQIMVRWDSGRSLILLDRDPFEVLG
jgi:Domain of unknown function (DUF4314)